MIDILVEAPVIVLTIALFRISPGAAAASVILGFSVLAYPILFHARWGQTLGKMAAKIKVVQLDGEPITAKHALFRSAVDVSLWVVYGIPTAWILSTWDGPAWSSLDWLAQRNLVSDRNRFYKPYDVVSQVWIWSEVIVLLFNRKRRALHDFIAGTVVVKMAPAESTFDVGTPEIKPVAPQ